MNTKQVLEYWGKQRRDQLPDDMGQETLDCIERLLSALKFIKELSGECMDNGDVRVGTAAEVAVRHIWKRADEQL